MFRYPYDLKTADASIFYTKKNICQILKAGSINFDIIVLLFRFKLIFNVFHKK
jgi:hypothetical protein